MTRNIYLKREVNESNRIEIMHAKTKIMLLGLNVVLFRYGIDEGKVFQAASW
jgi:hypothetical protein